jgi:hypothetical protein
MAPGFRGAKRSAPRAEQTPQFENAGGYWKPKSKSYACKALETSGPVLSCRTRSRKPPLASGALKCFLCLADFGAGEAQELMDRMMLAHKSSTSKERSVVRVFTDLR